MCDWGIDEAGAWKLHDTNFVTQIQANSAHSHVCLISDVGNTIIYICNNIYNLVTLNVHVSTLWIGVI